MRHRQLHYFMGCQSGISLLWFEKKSEIVTVSTLTLLLVAFGNEIEKGEGLITFVLYECWLENIEESTER